MKNLIQNQTSIDIVPYSENLKAEWDVFVNHEAINSTFLHSRLFFDHNLLNAKEDASLLFYKGTKIVAVVPAVIYLKEGKRILHSHLRATYGGFVISKNVGVEEAIDIVEQTVLLAKENNVDQIIVRNPFRIFNSELCDETDYAMWYRGFKIKSRELEIALQLNDDIQISTSRYHNDVIRNVKKAKENLNVLPLEDLKEFWGILERCLWLRHERKPVHDYTSIMKLVEAVGKEKILALGAYYNGKLIGGCIVFIANKIALHGQYIASDLEFQYLKPVHALIDYVVQYGSENGYGYFNFGMANEDEGKTINYGLSTLKEHFGGRGLLRETMYLDII
jgi:hypothetical protein